MFSKHIYQTQVFNLFTCFKIITNPKTCPGTAISSILHVLAIPISNETLYDVKPGYMSQVSSM